MPLPREAKLAVCTVGVYGCFLNWGYLQEKLLTTDYSTDGSEARWEYPLVLNLCMALACCATSLPCLLYFGEGSARPESGLALPAFSHVLASPFGYFSLKFINYPMLLLVKSSKLVPVMLLSYLLNGKTYNWKQMSSVLLISLGVALFSCKIHPLRLFSNAAPSSNNNNTLLGLLLVGVNLLLDGFTNARQDKYRDASPKISPFRMMYQMNIWQVIYLASYLSSTLLLSRSQLLPAITFLRNHRAVAGDLLLFSISGAAGQIFLFCIMAEFGSLVCVLITVTRKFFSILISVLVFGHAVEWWQWGGVGFVFFGLLLNSWSKYRDAAPQSKIE